MSSSLRRTKIVCTIGPASSGFSVMKRLLRAGMNVARLNFSHGTHEEHTTVIAIIRRSSKATGISCAILQDLQGPRIRIGELPKEGIAVKKGETVTLVPERAPLSWKERVGVRSVVIPQQYKHLARDVKKGTTILIADGAIALRVARVRGDAIAASVVVGGTIRSHKGINVPGVTLGASPITAKDKRDLAFGIEHGVDFVTLSFVRSAKDMEQLRRLISRNAKISPRLVAKVERPEAVKNIAEIAAVADAVMIGRGDLALEADPSALAVMQEDIIRACLRAGTPVITATQMLESMMTNPRPTRAELSDVGHAVMDHTDAVMLSEETAMGQYPVDACATMDAILRATEASAYDDLPDNFYGTPAHNHHLFAAHIAGEVRHHGARAIVVLPDALSVVPSIVRMRPEVAIVPIVSSDADARGFALSWGAYPVVVTSRTPANVLRAVARSRVVPGRGCAVLVNGVPEDHTAFHHFTTVASL